MVKAGIFTAIALSAAIISSASARTVASADVHLSVSPLGNDSNTCSSAAPCRTIQHAVDLGMEAYDLAGHGLFVDLAPGVYPESVSIVERPVGYHLVTIVGDCSNPGSATIDATGTGVPAVWVQDGSTAVLNCFAVRGGGIAARQYAIVDADSIVFAGAPVDLSATDDGRINIGNVAGAPPTTIAAGGGVFTFATNGGAILIPPGTKIAVSSPVAISYFILSYYNGRVFAAGAQVSGAANVSGQGGIVYEGGAVWLDGAVLPGTIANLSGQIY